MRDMWRRARGHFWQSQLIIPWSNLWAPSVFKWTSKLFVTRDAAVFSQKFTPRPLRHANCSRFTVYYGPRYASSSSEMCTLLPWRVTEFMNDPAPNGPSKSVVTHDSTLFRTNIAATGTVAPPVPIATQQLLTLLVYFRSTSCSIFVRNLPTSVSLDESGEYVPGTSILNDLLGIWEEDSSLL